MSRTVTVLLRVFARIVALLPYFALRPCGALLGWMAGSVLRIRTNHVVAAMRRAEIADEAAPAMYASLGRGLLELFWFWGATQARRDALLDSNVIVDPELARALDDACARGPVMLAASHTGNWEMSAYVAARFLAKRGKRLTVVAKPLSVHAINAFCMDLRHIAGLNVVPPRGAILAVRSSLQRGDVVAMLIDQVPDRIAHGVHVDFLGSSALADRAPASIACAHGATLLVVAATRRDDTLVVQRLAEFVPPAARSAADQWTANVTRASTCALERFVRAEPSSWLWLHRRWRSPAAAACPRSAPRLSRERDANVAA